MTLVSAQVLAARAGPVPTVRGVGQGRVDSVLEGVHATLPHIPDMGTA